MEPLIFEKSIPGRRSGRFQDPDAAQSLDAWIPSSVQRSRTAGLPEISEIDLVRHFTRLSRLNFCIDTQFYPLGSCTMKFNPKIHEQVARWPAFSQLHPSQPAAHAQGLLSLLDRLQNALCEITGMDAFSLNPAAGSQGELAGLLMIAAYQRQQGQKRKIMLIPDSAHGTNPASAALAGFEVVQIQSDPAGRVDMADLQKKLSSGVAGIMLTNPNTLGLFEVDILKIAQAVHRCGGLLYYDGANLNPLLGIARPGDMGFDIVHVNLHKSFSTPHGGGGPGAGPVGVKKRLEPFLPVPILTREGEQFRLLEESQRPQTIGRLKGFLGQTGVLLRAAIYVLTLGADGLRRSAENAILNANYLRQRLSADFDIPYPGPCMHEFVLSASAQAAQGVRALDIAKRLIDLGFHPPTIYFPLIVKEAMMVEPTETESIETLDAFVRAMHTVAQETTTDPQAIHRAPVSTPVGRLDEVRAARQPILKWPLQAPPA